MSTSVLSQSRQPTTAYAVRRLARGSAGGLATVGIGGNRMKLRGLLGRFENSTCPAAPVATKEHGSLGVLPA